MRRIAVLTPVIFLLMFSALPASVWAHVIYYTTGPGVGALYRYDFTVYHDGWLLYNGTTTPTASGQPIRGFHVDANGATITVVGSPPGWTGWQLDPNLVFWNITGNGQGQYQIVNNNALSGFKIETNGLLDGVSGGFFIAWGTHSGGDIHAGFLDSGLGT